MVDLDSEDSKSPFLQERIRKVRDKRLESERPGTKKAAETPHLFGEIRQPSTEYLGIPQTFSEGRDYITAKRLSPNVIANKKLFTAPDEDGFLFGVVSSSIFMAWQKAVGGRLKSDPSFSNTVVWNNFPLPPISHETRTKIIEAGGGVLEARKLLPERSLAEAYNPLTIDLRLKEAHDRLDAVMDIAMGAPNPLATERERLELLFAQYAKLVSDERR